MTLAEFEELVLTVLMLAAPNGNVNDLDACHRSTLVGLLVSEYTVRMPSDVAASREAARQQQDITDAVKMAAAHGKLHPFAHGEPS